MTEGDRLARVLACGLSGRALTCASAAAAAACALLAACVETSYRCRSDNDCDLGELGRCEPDGRCTSFDETCPTHRRYTEHSEELTGTCFDDAAALANPCAGGQPPLRAPEAGCLREVCDALPACCSTGWSDACVQAAQLRCELRCDTRLAITALANGRSPELFDLRWTGAAWTATQVGSLEAALAWLAPAPGELEPRLAGIANGALFVGTRMVRLEPGRAYQALTSVDLDRDGRDTVAVSSAFGAPLQHAVTVVKLDDDGGLRDLDVPRSQHLGWGDNDHDAFPDGVAGFNAGYAILDNVESDAASRSRALSATTNVNIGNVPTPGAPLLRGFDWMDLDGDGRFELLVLGTQVRVHAGDVRIANNPSFNRDCDPPVNAGACATPEAVAFAGVGLPSLDAPAVAIATFPARRMYRIVVGPGLAIEPLPDACPACPPIIALAARDLDGDRRIDLVGIDPRLGVHTALAADGYRFVPSMPIAAPPLPFGAVELSISGAPTP